VGLNGNSKPVIIESGRRIENENIEC
jgi:hypothetical protein